MKVPAGGRTYFWLALIGALFMLMFYFIYPYTERGLGPKQPISFSHRVHAGVKEINCRFCHPNVERSLDAGLPTVEKCFFCHKYIIPDHPEILREKQYFDSKTPVPWVRIFFTPDYVFFNHTPHVRWQKIECSRCHGEVEKMDRLRPVNFEMGFCIECHRKMKAQIDCWLACHR